MLSYLIFIIKFLNLNNLIIKFMLMNFYNLFDFLIISKFLYFFLVKYLFF